MGLFGPWDSNNPPLPDLILDVTLKLNQGGFSLEVLF